MAEYGYIWLTTCLTPPACTDSALLSNNDLSIIVQGNKYKYKTYVNISKYFFLVVLQ